MAHNIDRRASAASTTSQRTISTRRSSRNSNLFADELASDSFMVADGFRPRALSNDANPRRSRTPPRINERRSLALQPPIESSPSRSKKFPPMPSNQNGIAARNSFSLRHDTQQSDPPQRMASMASTATSDSTLRPLSTISDFTVPPRSQSPFVGASGPSHPYGMYPQNTSLNRASSTATVRPTERLYTGPDRPMHPYGVCPQTTTPEGEGDPLIASTDIASVGFPGLRQQYARRLGPDGEDADDIIGPDGHTEQLPPYTRYPDRRGEARSTHNKERSAPAAEASPPSSPDLPWTATTAASMSDALLPNRARSDGETTAVDSETASPEAESTKEKWAERSKRRTCFGKLPYWSICLMVFALVLLAAVGGAFLWRFIGSRHSSDNSHGHQWGMPDDNGNGTVYATSTATVVDALPLTSTPTALPVLPTGSFEFPMNMVSKTSASCLQNIGQWGGWGCASSGMMQFNVTNPASDTAQLLLTANDDDYRFNYGAQPPVFSSSTGVSLMLDREDPSRGPAYFFQHSYDKLVIVPHDDINQTGTTSKRWTEESVEEASLLSRRAGNSLRKNDTAWFCFWNSTMLEGFIYITQDVSPDPNILSSTSSAPVADVTSPPPTPGSLMSTPGSPASSSVTPTPSSRSDRDKRHNGDYEKNRHHGQDSDKESWHGNNGQWGQWDQNKGSDSSSGSRQYPKVVKLMERRTPTDRQLPYCQQMEIDENGNPSPTLDPERNPIKFSLEEMAPPEMKRVVYVGAKKGTAYYRRDRGDRGHKDDSMPPPPPPPPLDDISCQCEWLST